MTEVQISREFDARQCELDYAIREVQGMRAEVENRLIHIHRATQAVPNPHNLDHEHFHAPDLRINPSRVRSAQSLSDIIRRANPNSSLNYVRLQSSPHSLAPLQSCAPESTAVRLPSLSKPLLVHYSRT